MTGNREPPARPIATLTQAASLVKILRPQQLLTGTADVKNHNGVTGHSEDTPVLPAFSSLEREFADVIGRVITLKGNRESRWIRLQAFYGSVECC